MGNLETILERAEELAEALENDPDLLLRLTNCEDLARWQRIASHRFPAKVQNKMQRLSQENPDYGFLSVNDYMTGGLTANMDYFSVKVNKLPAGVSPNELLEEIRLDINSYINTVFSEFNPETNLDTGEDEVKLWNSVNPVGALLTIDIPTNPGSVMCVNRDRSSWMFTTVKTPKDGLHPVSGNREFGYKANLDGSIEIYTSGVDRFTLYKDEKLGEYLVDLTLGVVAEDAFYGADKLWKSFQKGLKENLERRGMVVEIIRQDPLRIDFFEIRRFLKGEIELEEIQCN